LTEIKKYFSKLPFLILSGKLLKSKKKIYFKKKNVATFISSIQSYLYSSKKLFI